MDKITVGDVVKSPTIKDRILFALVGGIIPGLWCYFGYIRPIKMAKNWIVSKLGLSQTDYKGK